MSSNHANEARAHEYRVQGQPVFWGTDRYQVLTILVLHRIPRSAQAFHATFAECEQVAVLGQMYQEITPGVGIAPRAECGLTCGEDFFCLIHRSAGVWNSRAAVRNK